MWSIRTCWRLRFSLRTMFVATALVCLACYYVLRPTWEARRVVQMVQAGDLAGVDALFPPPASGRKRDSLSDYASEDQWARSDVRLAPWSLRQLWRGERFVFAYVPRGHTMTEFDWSITLRVTARGVEKHLAIH